MNKTCVDGEMANRQTGRVKTTCPPPKIFRQEIKMSKNSNSFNGTDLFIIIFLINLMTTGILSTLYFSLTGKNNTILENIDTKRDSR